MVSDGSPPSENAQDVPLWEELPAAPPPPRRRRPWEPEEPVELQGGPPLAFTAEDYVAATTQEYRGLAAEVSRANETTVQRQAVAAAIPGVGTGLIGFEDVTGEMGLSELDVEAEEQARTSDLTLRVGTALVLVTLFMGSLVGGGWLFTGFVTLVMVLAISEIYATLRRYGYAPVALFGFLAVIGAALAGHLSGPLAAGAVVAAAMVAVGLYYTLARRRRPLENAGLTVLAAAWVASLSFAVMIGRSDSSVVLVMAVVLVTAFFDIGGFFVGRSFGRRRLAPVLSPNKTYEGLLGGVGLAVVVALLIEFIPLFDPIDMKGALWLCGLVCVLSPLGDAAESLFKRQLGVKDMSALLPGHGGMIDRIDGLLFVVPAAYFLFDALDYL